MTLLWRFLTWLERTVVAAFDEPSTLRWDDDYPTSNVRRLDVPVLEPWLADLEAVQDDDELRKFISHPKPWLTGPDAKSLLDQDMRRGAL